MLIFENNFWNIIPIFGGKNIKFSLTLLRRKYVQYTSIV